VYDMAFNDVVKQRAEGGSAIILHVWNF